MIFTDFPHLVIKCENFEFQQYMSYVRIKKERWPPENFAF